MLPGQPHVERVDKRTREVPQVGRALSRDVQDGKRHRVLNEDDAALTAARLALTSAVRTVLANGLGLLGMAAPERM